MRALFVVLLFAISSVVTAQQRPPGPGNPQTDGLFTSVLTYEIRNFAGSPVDKTEHTIGIGLPYDTAMLLKYVRVYRCLGQDANTFLEVLDEGQAGQDAIQALRNLLQQQQSGN